MRILLNRLTALGRKTGIGHYVTELTAALQESQPATPFVSFPGSGFEALVSAGRGIRGHVARLRPSRLAGESTGSHWKNALARGLSEWHFRALWSWRSFDLYHEPNHIP